MKKKFIDSGDSEQLWVRWDRIGGIEWDWIENFVGEPYCRFRRHHRRPLPIDMCLLASLRKRIDGWRGRGGES